MSAKKKTNKPKTEENDTLSEVDLALALSEIDQELARLGISLTPAQLPAYGPASKELQTSQIYTNVEHKLYFASEVTHAVEKDFDTGFEVADETDPQANEEQKRIAKIMEKNKLKDLAIEKQATVPLPPSKSELQRRRRQKADETAGAGWYNLKAPIMTPELEQDLKIVQLRAFVDPKKFFKRQKGEMPKHFEVGTLVANPLDFYSDGRSKAKMTKKHFADTLLEDQDYKKFAKRRYREIQNSRTGLKKKRKPTLADKNKRPFKKARKF